MAFFTAIEWEGKSPWAEDLAEHTEPAKVLIEGLMGLAALLRLMLSGLTLMWLWQWFVVPLQIHSLSWGQAMGVWLVVRLVIGHDAIMSWIYKSTTTAQSLVYRYTIAVVFPLSLLLLGYIIHWLSL